MRFVTSRAKLIDPISYAELIFGHHIENAARARVYASLGKRIMARWYGQQARNELASYLDIQRRLGHQA